jgi:hypothetical protein
MLLLHHAACEGFLTWLSLLLLALVAGTTFFKGSQGIDFCLPKESQLSPDAGQIYFSAAVLPELTLSVPRPSLAACIATCPPNRGCMVQYDVGAGVCYYAALPWDPPGDFDGTSSTLQQRRSSRLQL